MAKAKFKATKTRAGLDAVAMIEPTTGKVRDVQLSDVEALLKKGYKYAPVDKTPTEEQ